MTGITVFLRPDVSVMRAEVLNVSCDLLMDSRRAYNQAGGNLFPPTHTIVSAVRHVRHTKKEGALAFFFVGFIFLL